MWGALAVLRKEMAQLRRDRKSLFLVLFAPVAQMVVLGYAATTDVRRVEVAVCDLDHSQASRRLVASLVSSGTFRQVASLPGPEVHQVLQRGEASVAVVIPSDFSSSSYRGEVPQVKVVVDGSNPLVATVASGYVWEAFGAQGRDRDLVRATVWYNPALRSKYFMVPGTLALIIMVMTMMLTAMAIVREFELGTMEQVLVTPLRPAELISGKLLAYSLVALAEVVVALPVVRFWLGVPLEGSWVTLVLLSLPFMLCTLALGVFISTISRTQQQAMMITAFVFMVPQIYLSGFVFPIRSMPRFFQLLSYAVPLRYYATIVRGVYLKGVGLSALWPQVAALLVLGSLLLALARWRFRGRLG